MLLFLVVQGMLLLLVVQGMLLLLVIASVNTLHKLVPYAYCYVHGLNYLKQLLVSNQDVLSPKRNFHTCNLFHYNPANKDF